MAWSLVWGGLAGNIPRVKAGAQLIYQDAAPPSGGAYLKFDLYFNTPNSYAYNGMSYSWTAWTSEGNFASGSGTFNANGSNFTSKIGSVEVWNPVTWRAPLDWHFQLNIPNKVGGGTASVRVDGYTPYALPAAPDPATAVLLTGPERASLTWYGNQNQAARIETIAIDRESAPYSGGATTTYRIANISGDSTSIVDSSLEAGFGYRYRVQAQNSSGQSAWVYTGWVDTTPLDVSNITAAKTSAGDIAVTWSNPVRWWNGQSGRTEIYDVGSGSPVLLVTLDGNISSWTHLSPSTSQPHRYNVRHATYNTPVLRSSDQVLSNTITLITPPLAPTGIGPAIMDPLDSPRPSVVWTHNPVDTTGQTAYQLQHRLAGSGTWTTLAKTVSTVSAYQTTGVYSRGQSMEVQVRTWGAATTGGSDGTGASPWSATQVVVMDGRPAATILTPPDGVSEVDTLTVNAGCTTAGNVTVTLDGAAKTVALATSDNTATLVATKIRAAAFPGWSTGGTGAVVTFTAGSIGTRTAPAYSPGSTGAAGSIVRTTTGTGIPPVGGASLTATHAYSDPESAAQSAAEWRLLDAAGATVLEVIPINGPDTSVTFTTVLANSTTYQVDVRVRDGAGQWSARTSRAFAVAYLPPAVPSAAVQWDEVTGSCQVTLTRTAPTGSQVEADTVQVVRGGVVVGIVDAPLAGAPVTIIDPIPPTDADPLQLEVVAWANSGSQASALVDVPVPRMVHRTVYFNAGTGWSIVAAAMYDLTVSEDVERAVQATEFAGRPRPVLTYGEAVTETIKISGKLPPEADRLTFGAVQQAGTVVCLRWPEGRRWVMLSGPSMSTGASSPGHTISLSATVVDHTDE